MILLTKLQNQNLQRGHIIKMLDLKSRENTICFMICEVSGEKTYQLIHINGYKAGIPFQILPKEALSEPCGVNANWLIEYLKIGISSGYWKPYEFSIDNIYILKEPSSQIFSY